MSKLHSLLARRALLASAIGSLALAGACGGPPSVTREKDPARLATADQTVLVAMDDDVKWELEVIDHRSQLLPDGRLRAQVRFVNRTSRELRLQLSVTFKDDRNFAVEPDTPFEHHVIAGGQTLDLSKESLATGATSFHVQARTAKEGS